MSCKSLFSFFWFLFISCTQFAIPFLKIPLFFRLFSLVIQRYKWLGGVCCLVVRFLSFISSIQILNRLFLVIYPIPPVVCIDSLPGSAQRGREAAITAAITIPRCLSSFSPSLPLLNCPDLHLVHLCILGIVLLPCMLSLAGAGVHIVNTGDISLPALVS